MDVQVQDNSAEESHDKKLNSINTIKSPCKNLLKNSLEDKVNNESFSTTNHDGGHNQDKKDQEEHHCEIDDISVISKDLLKIMKTTGLTSTNKPNNLPNTSVKIRKRLILDSDSDSENINDLSDEHETNIKSNSSKAKYSFSSDEEPENDDKPVAKNQQRKALFDSDSDFEDRKDSSYKAIYKSSDDDNSGGHKSPVIQKSKRHTALFDSDSEPEIATQRNTKLTEAPVYNLNCKGELVPETISGTNISKSTFSNLFDSESSDDETRKNNTESERDSKSPDAEDHIKPKAYKKKITRNKDIVEKPKKMTGKDAAKLRQEIKSESQRMLRESNVSLPYHKPKSHTLQEFMSRRPKLASAGPLSSRLPASVAIKMSTEQLKIVSEKLKKREKELKEFYKSESEHESDNDNDKDYVPPGEDGIITNVTENCEEVITDSDSKMTTTDNGTETKSNTCVLTETLGNTEEVTQKDQENVTENIDTLRNSEDTNHLEKSAMEIDVTVESVKQFGGIEENTQIDIETKNREDNDSSNSVENEDSSTEENKNVSTKSPGEVSISNEDKTIERDVSTDEPMSYDFNLDDIEENIEKEVINEQNKDESEKKIPEKSNKELTENANNLNENSSDDKCFEEFVEEAKTTISEPLQRQRKFEFTDLDREIENFGEKQNVQPVKKLSKLELIKETLINFQPRLSGGPDEVIDLDSSFTKPNEVNKLMERFMKHSNVKKQTPKNKVKLSIVTVESGGDIHEETVAMNVEKDEAEVVVDEKPGEKLKKLREELEMHMFEQKSKIWQQKASKGIVSGENKGEDVEYTDDFDDILDDEDEAEMTDNEESDEELCESDEDHLEKPTKKAAFVDDEAEESELEECDNNEEIDRVNENEGCQDSNDNKHGHEENIESSNEEQRDGDSEDSSSDNDDELNDNNENENEPPGKKKTLKRIIKAFEDSDDEDVIINENNYFVTPNKLNRTTHLDTTETAEEDDMFIPPHQLPPNKTPIRQVTPTRSHFHISTPLSLMSEINLNSAQKGSPSLSQREELADSSPVKVCSNSNFTGFQKKLFSESLFSNQEVDMDNLAEICSGQFPATQEAAESQEGEQLALTKNVSQEEKEKLILPSVSENLEISEDLIPPSTQDLFNICSGGFTGLTGLNSEENEKEQTNKEDVIKSNGDSQIMITKSTEVKGLDEGEDLIISQLLDEEELENFKRKFDSPVVRQTPKKMIIEDAEEIQGGGRIESDDEDDGQILIKQRKKKKRNKRKIVFSDDDSTEDEEQQNDAEEKIDLYDSCEDEDVQNIGYDSEENEIDITTKGGKEILKLGDFFEAEAELSESEWGSADEDEKDLDKLEFELGDTEKFDEEKVREDIGKIQMKRMLDDDTREVKLLQELLLDDGELHGTGRQRQFKWKNIDSLEGDENGDKKPDDDEVFMDEEESEEQWRKRRHEREMFLKEKLKSVSSKESQEESQLIGTSQILKLGEKVLQRSQSQNDSQGNTPAENVVNPDVPKNSVIKHSLTLLNKRGSFLSRGDQVLQRLAEYTKVTTILGTATAKNSKNFLFQTVSTTETISMQNKKRKSEAGTPNIIKKLRLSSSDLSPAGKKKSGKPERAKKLFGNV